MQFARQRPSSLQDQHQTLPWGPTPGHSLTRWICSTSAAPSQSSKSVGPTTFRTRRRYAPCPCICSNSLPLEQGSPCSKWPWKEFWPDLSSPSSARLRLISKLAAQSTNTCRYLACLQVFIKMTAQNLACHHGPAARLMLSVDLLPACK